ncbi:MAG: sulfatase [Verrucomicrobiota bacterium]
MGFVRILLVLLAGVATTAVQAEQGPPNILFIVLDDQNTFAGLADLAPVPISPNMNRIEATGVSFLNANCTAPVCNPSRTSFLSGLRPSTSGIYSNNQGRTPADHILTRTTPLPIWFRERGYLAAGCGKVFSSAYGSFLKNQIWDDAPPRDREKVPEPEGAPVQGLGKNDWAPSPAPREQLPDWKNAGWAAEFLMSPQPKPFFLAVGIVKPHTPWYVPQEYFDLFPPEQLNLPPLAEDENAGLPDSVKVKLKDGPDMRVERRNEMVSGYLAASRYADDCVGRVLDGLEKGPHREDTIVVYFSDHGYEFGDKHNWSKGSAREGSARVPLVISGPGLPEGETSTRPVSLLDLYPTLVELAGLPANPDNEGRSFVPLLRKPNAKWEHAAITTAGFGNHAVRTERWRYIRHEDGAEELYDHQTDPRGHTNLAADPEFVKWKRKLGQWLPGHDEPVNPPIESGGTR